MKDRSTDNGAFALILTMAILAIATILAVAFANSMRTERQASASLMETERAKLLAQSALDHAISILDENIPQPAPPAASPYPLPPAGAPTSAFVPTNWVVNPGRLTTQTGGGALRSIPLSSNPVIDYTPAIQDANLNPRALSGGSNLTLATSDPMRVAWITILKDPTAAASASNPIVGRYAFWIDDENARVDLNTAFGKGSVSNGAAPQVVPGTVKVGSSIFPIGHPTSINLDALDASFDKAALASSPMRSNASRGNMRSSAEAKPFFSTRAAFDASKFFVTTSSNDPEYNVFGKSRLFFSRYVAATTLMNQVNQFAFDWDGATYFPRDENKVTSAGADNFALYRTAAVISNLLNRNDWPGMPSRSFVDKWGGGSLGLREADQVAWNAVVLGGYGNVADSASPSNAENNVFADFQNFLTSGPGFTGSSNLPNSAIPVGRLSAKAIMPALPKPGIQEIALQATPVAAGVGNVRIKLDVQCEFYLGDRFPTNLLSSKSGTGLGFFFTYFWFSVSDTNNASVTATDSETHYFKKDGGGSTPDYTGVGAMYGYAPTSSTVSLSPGSYTVIATNSGQSVYVANGSGSGLNTAQSSGQKFSNTTTVRVQAKMRLVSKYSGGTIGYASGIPIQVIPVWDSHDPAGSGAAPIQPPTGEKDTIDFDFLVDTSSTSPTVQSVEVPVPQLAGRAASWSATSLPTLGAKNIATTAAGDVSKLNAYNDLSVGNYPASEKPSIGMISVVPTGMQRGLTTTVSLHPAGNSAELPDWLLLDLLAPSVESPTAFNNSTCGKVNINASIFPAGSALFAPPDRTVPLQAVFQNMASNPATLASDIFHRKKAGNGTEFGISDAYDYIGEICETAGVADSGGTDWDKEFLIRNLAGCLTTRSNAFRVIGVAQLLKKRPGNTAYDRYETGDILTGEKRFEAIVQRYMWQGKDSNPGNAHVDSTGKYDRLTVPSPGWPGGSNGQTGPMSSPDYNKSGTWERMDGPDAPTYAPQPTWGTLNYDPAPYSFPPSSAKAFQQMLEAADNPLRPVAKFRTVNFRYLNE